MEKHRLVDTPDYRYIFNNENGTLVRWGCKKEIDPLYSPLGPEILDIEVSTICNGIDSIPCTHCYKENTGNGANMTFGMFERIFRKIPRVLTQIAFGIGDISANLDLPQMLRFCRENDYNQVIPNITTNGFGILDKHIEMFSQYCGAVGVSRYGNKDLCYDTIDRLKKAGVKQVNMHLLVSEETEERCYETIQESLEDERLKGLHAILFLLLKPKGSKNRYHQLKIEKLRKLLKKALDEKTRIALDSCCGPIFIEMIKDHPAYQRLLEQSEPCEGTLFSGYINVDGMFYPCSFTEEATGGLNVLECNDFLMDVWYNPKTNDFRRNLLSHDGDRKCPTFDLYHDCSSCSGVCQNVS